MPLYEIVLRFPDHDEVRLTDANGYEPGAAVLIDNRTYLVVGTGEPREPNASARFVLEPVGDDT